MYTITKDGAQNTIYYEAGLQENHADCYQQTLVTMNPNEVKMGVVMEWTETDLCYPDGDQGCQYYCILYWQILLYVYIFR